MDAISDRGLQSYLQHHWVIIRLIPAGDHLDQSLTPGSSTESHTSNLAEEAHEPMDTTVSNLPPDVLPDQKKQKLEYDLGDPIAAAPREHQQCSDDIQTPNTSREEPSGEETGGVSNKERAHQPITTESMQIPQEAPGSECTSAPETDHRLHPLHTLPPNTKLSTETQLMPVQVQSLQPDKDHGFQLAKSGKAWYLRIDRQVYIAPHTIPYACLKDAMNDDLLLIILQALYSASNFASM